MLLSGKAYTGTNIHNHSSEKLVLLGGKAHTGTNKHNHSSEKLVLLGGKAHTGTKNRKFIFYLGGGVN